MLYQRCVQNPLINPIQTSVKLGSSVPTMLPPPSTSQTEDIDSATLDSLLEHQTVARKRGRPRKARYTCRYCGGFTRITPSYCCQYCDKPWVPAGTSGRGLLDCWKKFVSSYDWTHFGTGTFPWPMEASNEHIRLAVQSYQRRFFEWLQRYYPRIAWFSVGEPDSSGQLHIHWVCYAPTLNPKYIENRWTKKYEGIAEVGSYHLGASVYTCKTLDRSDLHSTGGDWQPLR